jgi:dienelactone hydrolase
MAKCRLRLLAGLLVLGLGAVLLAQQFQPPPPQKLDEQTTLKINAKLENLRGIVTSLRKQGLPDPWLSDIEIYLKAATWAVEHNEFPSLATADWTLEALERGTLRARLASSGETPWYNQTGFPVVRAYRSKIDDSLQPYAVTLPKDYGKNPKKKWRLDVVLHGRDPSLNEIKFLHQFSGEKAGPAPDYVRLDIFGRGNNAYRWAGEVDVLEALNAFAAVETKLGRGQLPDPAKVVLRGFSMGGAGTWHLGLHMPDRWCVIGPGAGFTATHGYAKGLPAKLPDYQEKCLRIYDAVDYAENVFDVPVVAYAGADDDQLQAARNIEERLKDLPFKGQMKLLVAPGLKHAFPAEWQKKAEEAYAPFAAKGRPDVPDHVRFVTYTLKYPTCEWVEILALNKHYEKALVDAKLLEKGYEIKTANVQALHLTVPADSPTTFPIKIDGQTLDVRAWVSQNLIANVYLRLHKGMWKSVLPQKLLSERAQKPRKVAGLTGPIDDAFTDTFLCVRGTGKTWHPAIQAYTDARLEQFKKEWSKFWRGELPIKNDNEISDQDIAGKHLILFGDPASNSLISQVLDGLPLDWDQKQITLGGQTYKSADHVPVLIYPSPLNSQRYVVLNSGHTFHQPDYIGTNALLYPRLGDYAILHLAASKDDPLAVEVGTAGLFDDSWQIGTKAE